MKIENNDKRTFEFSKEGVVINIPRQLSGIVVIPRLLELAWQPAMREQSNFAPNRLVINAEFVDEKNPGVFLEQFDPPIEIQVYYTLGDRSFADKDKKPIAIAYWKNERWKLIDLPNHNLTEIYPILSQSWIGALRFFIRSWGEPTIALGS
jgi:hypothetical protein